MEQIKKPLAVLMFDDRVVIDANELVQTLKALYPRECGNTSAVESSDTPLFEVVGIMFAMIVIDTPFADEWKTIANRSVHWKDGSATCIRQRSHVIMTPFGSSADFLQASRVLSAIIGAIAAMKQSLLGVLWNSIVLNSRDSWLERSRTAFSKTMDLPWGLWVSLHPFRTNNGNLAACTQGLSAYVPYELEFENGSDATRVSPLINMLASVAAYVISAEATLRAGSTFSSGTNEQIRLQAGISQNFANVKVLYSKIDLD